MRESPTALIFMYNPIMSKYKQPPEGITEADAKVLHDALPDEDKVIIDDLARTFLWNHTEQAKNGFVPKLGIISARALIFSLLNWSSKQEL